jgi:ATP-dependent DNA helicase RecG
MINKRFVTLSKKVTMPPQTDETLLPEMTIQQDIDEKEFARFFEKEFGETISEQELSIDQLFTNLNLSKANTLNLAAALLFGKNNRFKLPAFSIKCVTYPSEDIHSSTYIDSKDSYGNARELFDDAFAFVQRNLRNIQNGQNVNSIGELEIPKIVLEELLTNAIIHRDYFITAPIRIFVFSNRVEIISPGHLPNNLTVENVKNGNSNMRNPVLSSFATKILPYRGLGNGIRRAIKVYPEIDFIDDRAGNEFRCVIHRRVIKL